MPNSHTQLTDLGATAEWTLSVAGDAEIPAGLDGAGLVDIPARVPGCVHTDLLAAGLIDDPLAGVNEQRVAWISESEWEYTARFDVDAARLLPDRRIDLRCDGLQTVSVISVNGRPIGRTENMHRRYTFDITEALTPGPNVLSIRFVSSVAVMRERATTDLPYDWAHPYNRLRVMASSVGWDWGPTLVGAGIWRAIALRDRTRVSFEASMTTTLDAGLREGTLDVEVTIASDGEPRAEHDVEIRLGTYVWRRRVGEGSTRLSLLVVRPELWWPRGYGASVLHDATVTLLETGERVHARVGFRHVELDTPADAYGRGFTLRVNGRPVFARGANWIPDDVLISRMSPERYAARIDDAVAANMNMLRVWGGGVYEDESFYAICDERGVLVWQDFMFACAAYPEEEPLAAEVEAEARDVVSRIAAHPSVVVWNGSNETLLAWHDWGWRDRIGAQTWGDGYYRGVLASAVERGAPGAVYLASSPVSLSPDVHPNAPGDGTVHVWDARNRLDYGHYRDDIPRFVAEFGFQAPANWTTLADAVGAADVDPRSPVLEAHQKQPGGMQRLISRLDGRFPNPAAIAVDPPRWHAATQLNQAHALRVGIEHFRSWWPRTTGALIWQLNDTWPAISWSLVDSAGRRKLAWFGVRRAFADRLVTIQQREAGLSLVLINDTDEPWADRILVRRIDVTRGERARREVTVLVEPRCVQTVVLDAALTLPRERRDEILVADAVDASGTTRLEGASRAVHTFVTDDAIRWDAARFDAELLPARGDDVLRLRVTARSTVTDLSLLVDRLYPDAVVDSALVTLVAGESHTFSIHTSADITVAALTSWPVLVSRNAFFHA